MLLLVLKADAARDAVVRVSALVIALSIYLSIVLSRHHLLPAGHRPDQHGHAGHRGSLALVIIVLSVKFKKHSHTAVAIQTPLLVWFGSPAATTSGRQQPYIDKLPIIMRSSASSAA